MEARVRDYGSIGWAVSHLKVGHEVRREGWRTNFLKLKDDHIWMLVADDDPGISFVVTQDDLTALDWQLRDPTLPGEYHL